MADKVYSIDIDAPAHKVWEQITSVGKVQRHIFDCVLDNNTPGKKYLWHDAARKRAFVRGEIVEVTPPSAAGGGRFVQTFKFTNLPDDYSLVTWEITPIDSNRTKVVVTHSKLDPMGKTIKQIEGGWPGILANLRSVCETGTIPFKTRAMYAMMGAMSFVLPKSMLVSRNMDEFTTEDAERKAKGGLSDGGIARRLKLQERMCEMTRSLLIVLLVVAAARADAPPAIGVEGIVNAPVAEVWKKWTTSEGVASFLDTPANIELRPGGPFEIYFKPDAPQGQRGSEGCTVLSWLPERMLSITWNAPPKYPGVRNGSRHTFVVITLDAMDPATTRVRLTHDGWPEAEEAGALAEEWKGTHEYFENAWPNVMKALADSFSPAESTPDPKSGWLYLVTEFRRPDLLTTMTDAEKEVFSRHLEYMTDLSAKGALVVAGPCTDLSGRGIVVFQAVNEPAARAIMEADPALKEGLIKAELHPMRLVFLRGRD